MKCAIATIHYGTEYEKLANLTWNQNRMLYAQQNGYAAMAKTDGFNGMNLGFAKIQFLLELLDSNQFDAIHWSGTDTMITNFSIPLTTFLYDNYHVTIATDFNGIQSDSFVVRNTPEGREWLQNIMNKMPEYIQHPFLEQGVMMESYQQYQNIVKIVPQRFLNSYYYSLYRNKGAVNNNDKMGLSGQWELGDFLLHAPDQPMNIRYELFTHTLHRITGKLI